MEGDVVGTSYVKSTNVVIETNGIVVGDLRDLSIFPIGLEKKIYSSFDGCTVPLY